MNLINEESPHIDWYTDLQPFLSRMGNKVESYQWLISDFEVNVAAGERSSLIDTLLSEMPGPCWLSGGELLEISQLHPQFLWGVFSAVPQERFDAASHVDVVPFADGNRALWIGSPNPQHPDADFEIVCWDSGATLLIGADEETAQAFRGAYPGATDLDRANARRNQS